MTRSDTAAPEPIRGERTARVEAGLADAVRRPGRATLLDDLADALAERQSAQERTPRRRAAYWSGMLLAPALAALVATASWWLWARDSIRASATRADVEHAVGEHETATEAEFDRAATERRDLREWQIRTTEIDRQQSELLDALDEDVRQMRRRRR